ncbi:choline transporter-like protein 1 isoform X2 [Brevipalpus obovatus]|uniref:choline transporter-like protein 1 isoform X2 n=1 Tax=Brevipalpus obovatus TaxID=246614 RepID=UPI003D9EACAD
MNRPKIFTFHPIDQPSNQPPWPSPVHHQPMINVHHPNVQATSQVTAPPLAYYYSSPRSSEDSGREDGPYRGRPSYLRRQKSSISFISNNRQSDHEGRQTTDLFFLLIFLLFFGFLGYTLFDTIVIKKTNPNLMLHGYDNWGNICGQRNKYIKNVPYSGQDMFRKPYLLMYYEMNITNKICVENCNEAYFIKTTFNRCLPRKSELQPLMHTMNYTRSFLDAIASDVITCLNEIALLFGISFGMALLLVILLRFMASLIIWTTLIALSLAAILATAQTWLYWYSLKKGREMSEAKNSVVMDGEKTEDDSIERWLTYSVIASILTSCFLLIMLVLRKRIQLVCMLFKEAGKAIGAIPMLLLQPIITLTILSAIGFGWLIGTLFLMSNRQPVVDPRTGFVVYTFPTMYKYIKWINIFAFLWAIYFVTACQHYVIASSVVKWFFARDKERLGFPLIRSIVELVRYHLGSVALGSLLVAGMKALRLLLKKIEAIFSGNRTKESCSHFGKIFYLCFCIFEKFITYLNKNAYIVMAIHGKSFSTSAKRAFSILSANTLRIAAINSVGDFLLLLGKLLIVTCTAIIGMELIRDKVDKLNYSWSPIIIAIIFAYFISHCFLAVYEMTIDTLFICFCEECSANDGRSVSFFLDGKSFGDRPIEYRR